MVNTSNRHQAETIKVDLSHFPTDERFAQIPNKLVLADNLNGESFDSEEKNRPNFPVQLNMAVIFICVKGQIDMSIDLRQHTLTDGASAIVVPGSFFQMKHLKQGTTCLFMAVSPDFLNYSGDVKLGIDFGRALREMPVYQLSEEELQESLSIYQSLKRKLLTPHYLYKEEVAKSYLHILQCNAFQIFRLETKQIQDQKPPSRKEELYISFMRLVRAHYMTNRNIGFYADQLFVSPKYLSSIIHEVSGNYATDWINQYVILEAKSLLRTKGISIKEVSNKLNFANQSFFAKYFKQHTGYTPKEYKTL
ncbi:MAG: AraC family transcriptional regulator [Bacteroidales bacterium]|nr:AraC family transcriptional regulator [Bacteroidales bacterium]